MAKSASITVLSDNHCTCRPFKAEHGLSLFVETPGANILFDTGASPLFVDNAEAMKLELFGVDSIVLSHGHFDHCDGVRKALSEAPNAHLVLHEAALEPKMSQDLSGHFFSVGMGKAAIKAVKSALTKGRATFIDGPVRLGPNIVVFPVGPRNAVPTGWPYYLQAPDGGFIPDTLKDELCMLVLGDRAAALVVGDSHCGLVKAYKRGLELTNGLPITSIVGGTCINDSSFASTQALANFLLKIGVNVCLGHATGLEGYGTLRRMLGSKVKPMRVGLNISLPIFM